MVSLLDRYDKQIEGVLSCYDRILIQGTLPRLCFAGGMTSFLYERGVRIFDYAKFAEPLRDGIRENAERIAAENGLQIQFIRKFKSTSISSTPSLACAMFASQRGARSGCKSTSTAITPLPTGCGGRALRSRSWKMHS